jgi:hypothetical protein
MRNLLTLILFITACPSLRAQVNVKDSVVATPLIGFSFGYQLPGGDLSKRFGNSSDAGLTFFYKTKKNLLLDAQATYFFSNNVNEYSILDSIKDSNGGIINQNGQYADIRLYERGWNIHAGVGKLFNKFGPNPNSGLVLMAGLGFLQHKIRIEDIGNQSPQLAGDYKKGYDRLTSGLSVHEFVGYMYLGENRMVNFFGGIELTQAFTKSRRSWDYDLMRRDETKRFDLLSGVRIGWILPLYKKAPKEYYYY